MRHDVTIYSVDSGGADNDVLHPVTKLAMEDYTRPGYVAVASKIYVIGGEYLDTYAETHPKNVYIWDLRRRSELKEGRECYYEWELGPKLEGGKPHPMVVVLNGKIYALAGYTLCLGIPDPAFEVLDLSRPGAAWTALPNPPFQSLYGDTFRLWGYTVIGDIIYYRLSTPVDEELVYPFDTANIKWLPDSGCNNTIARNLGKLWWEFRVDMVNDMIFQVSFYRGQLRVYAYDVALASKLDELFQSNRNHDSIEELVDDDCDNCYMDYFDDSIRPHVKFPVHGFDEIKHLIKCDPYPTGFLTCLGDEMFCLVCICDPHEGDPFFCICTFQVNIREEEGVTLEGPLKRKARSFHAVNLQHRSYKITEELGGPCTWSIM